MRVLKFGGSSVASPERISQIASILKSYYEQGINFTVVFSAFGGVTDSLLSMSKSAAEGDQTYIKHLDALVSVTNKLLQTF